MIHLFNPRKEHAVKEKMGGGAPHARQPGRLLNAVAKQRALRRPGQQIPHADDQNRQDAPAVCHEGPHHHRAHDERRQVDASHACRTAPCWWTMQGEQPLLLAAAPELRRTSLYSGMVLHTKEKLSEKLGQGV